MRPICINPPPKGSKPRFNETRGRRHRLAPARLAAHSEVMPEEFTGMILIAMPGMGDPRFQGSVVYLCDHSEKGAMGLIVNKPSPNLSARDLLKQLDIVPSTDLPPIRVHFGGPVEHGRGFVLHSGEYKGNDTTLKVDDRFAMTSTTDILEDIARGGGPERTLLALGYAGWGPGQLENELVRNGWLATSAEPDLVFGRDNERKWSLALKAMGIDPLMLSGVGGNA